MTVESWRLAVISGVVALTVGLLIGARAGLLAGGHVCGIGG